MDIDRNSADARPRPTETAAGDSQLSTRRAHIRSALLSVPFVLTVTSTSLANGKGGGMTGGNYGYASESMMTM